MKLNLFLNRFSYKLMASAVIVLILAGGMIYLYNYTAEIRDEKKNDLQAIAELKLGQIVSWRKEKFGDAYVLSESPLFCEAVENWISHKNNLQLKGKILKRLNSFIQAYNYKNIVILSPSGKVLLTFDSELNDINHITKHFVIKSAHEKKIEYTDFYYCDTHHKIHLDIIAPLTNSRDRVFAVLMLNINPDDYIYPLIQTWPTYSESAETLIVRKEGDEVVFLNKLRHINNENLSFRQTIKDNKLPAALAVLGFTGILDGVDYRGVEVLADLRPVPDSPWFLVTKIDKSEVFSTLYYRQLLIILSMILSIIAFISATAFMYNYRQADIYKQLYEKEKELKDRLEEFRTILYSIGDGVITTDDKGLIRILNKTAEELSGWSENEAEGRSIEKVFNIVNEGTLEKHENPVFKIIREGVTIGLANHTLLISKNGIKIPIADSGAPIMDEAGNITGVVLVFRDQTSERDAQNKLMRKSEQLESMFENMINAFIIWESVFNDKGDYVSFRFGKFNKAFAGISGLDYNEVYGKDVFEVWPETEQSWVEVYRDVALTGRSSTFEMYHKPTGGYYHCNAYRPSESQDRICVIFEDITERKENEEKINHVLAEKETLLRELYHRTKNNMQVIYSILALQAEASDDEDFKLLIEDTNNRIMSMSLVHQMLYRSKNLSSINLDEYITDLVSLLTGGFNVLDGKVQIEMDLKPVPVLIDKAVPCGLIMNELISNVFKHAFPGEREGLLTINLCLKDEGQVEIIVCDNGRGVPDGFDFYSQKSLGLQLIVSITQQQLNGTVDFISEEGVKCMISFINTKNEGTVYIL
jgi:PAS domain S-box-containing protein